MVSFLHLSQVAEVISFHFEIEDCGSTTITTFAIGNEIIVQNILWQKKRQSKPSEKYILI